MLQAFVANTAITGLLIAIWAHLQGLPWLQHGGRSQRAFGGLMGAAAGAAMLFSFEVQPGIIIDMRTVPLALAGLVGGPVAAAIAAGIGIAVRAAFGGAGMVPGLLGIALAGLAGWAGSLVIRRLRVRALPGFAGIALPVTVAPMLTLALLPVEAFTEALRWGTATSILLNFTSLTLALWVIRRVRDWLHERTLLLAAMEQAPDYLYVKDMDSRLVAANRAVARLYGRAQSAALRGLTDADLTAPDRAAALLAEERKVLDGGPALLDAEEQVADLNGDLRWYATSKQAVTDAGGRVLGLVGVTRDITQRKMAERDLLDSRNQLQLVTSHMSDGIALFDSAHRIVMCNEKYRSFFPLTGNLRVPGTDLSAILTAAVERGEQIDITQEGFDAWRDGVLRALETGGEEEVHLMDGRWLHIRTTTLPGGGATVVVSDVTHMKRAELDLKVLSEQLKVLAATDGLTGVNNRRALDERLATEVGAARRGRPGLAILLIDVDHFKAFNDLYGHLAGDDCLRRVAGAIADSLRRPTDFVARYGGEEFCVVLPETGQPGALQIAKKIQSAVRELDIPHTGAVRQQVTVSIGVASAAPREALAAKDLLERADQALYAAKTEGRDCVRASIPERRRAPAA